MEVFVRSRQSCERCLAHGQHHQLPTWSRRQVLALKNDHFPTRLVMMELHCKLPFPSGPVRHPGLRRYFGPPRCLGTVVVPTWGERMEFASLLLAFAAAHHSSPASLFFRKPFLPGDRTVEQKKQNRRPCRWQLRLKARDLIIVRERYP